MPQALDERRRYSQSKLAELREHIAGAEALAASKACVYLTGSFGRGEACRHSDLDVFIVGLSGTEGTRQLSKLDEICLKVELIQAVRALHFPEFSGDGEYLRHYEIRELVNSIGTPQDDAENTFTARLLLLLESAPLVGSEIHQRAIDDVIAAYWRDFTTHQSDFRPAFLANDILRLWRTFCVNYEARTRPVPEQKLYKRRLKNYKLRHSRLLTCYSALLYLMAIWKHTRTVSPTDARQMARLTPTQRLEEIMKMPHAHDAVAALETALECYNRFLEESNAAETALLEKFADNDYRRATAESAAQLGDAIFQAIRAIGTGDDFHRLLVV